MAERRISMLYDAEGDILDVLWGEFGKGFSKDTDDDRIMVKIDDDGDIIGFMIDRISTFKGPSPHEFVLDSDYERGEPDSYDLVSTKEAARQLGISEGRVRQILGEGRMVGARRVGHGWVIPSPVQITPGARGPVGAAGSRHND